jgi:hydroxypyruvate isomerase
MTGNLTNIIHKSIKYTKHIQIASPPNRYEPDNGEINYPFVFNMINELNYQGYIGCEYKPSTNTKDSLSWAKKYNIK